MLNEILILYDKVRDNYIVDTSFMSVGQSFNTLNQSYMTPVLNTQRSYNESNVTQNNPDQFNY
jgi:hypothetical protein